MAILTMALLTMALLTMALLTVVLLTCQADILPPAATTLTPLDLPSPARRALGGSAGGAGGTLGGALGGAASDWQDWCCASLLRMVGAELLVEMLSATAQALLTMAIYLLWLYTYYGYTYYGRDPSRRGAEGSLPCNLHPQGDAPATLWAHACNLMHMPMCTCLRDHCCCCCSVLTMAIRPTYYTRRGHCCCSILTMAMLTVLGGVTAATRRRVARSHCRRRRACRAPRALSVAGRLLTRTSAEDAGRAAPGA